MVKTTYFTLGRDGVVYQHSYHMSEHEFLIGSPWSISWSQDSEGNEAYAIVKGQYDEMCLSDMIAKIRVSTIVGLK